MDHIVKICTTPEEYQKFIHKHSDINIISVLQVIDGRIILTYHRGF